MVSRHFMVRSCKTLPPIGNDTKVRIELEAEAIEAAGAHRLGSQVRGWGSNRGWRCDTSYFFNTTRNEAKRLTTPQTTVPPPAPRSRDQGPRPSQAAMVLVLRNDGGGVQLTAHGCGV